MFFKDARKYKPNKLSFVPTSLINLEIIIKKCYIDEYKFSFVGTKIRENG